MRAQTRRSILIVDDERDLVLPLALRLEADGRFAVATAFDGEDGYEKAVRGRPDIALIDLSMPMLDGWQLCRRLHEDSRTRHTRVIIMTAWVSKDSLENRALAEGVTTVLVKPIEVSDLMRALEAAAPDDAAGEGGVRQTAQPGSPRPSSGAPGAADAKPLADFDAEIIAWDLDAELGGAKAHEARGAGEAADADHRFRR